MFLLYFAHTFTNLIAYGKKCSRMIYVRFVEGSLLKENCYGKTEEMLHQMPCGNSENIFFEYPLT